MRYLFSIIGYAILFLIIYVVAIESQSQLFAIFFWIMLALPIINIFRTMTWVAYFWFTEEEKNWKKLILRYFLNTFIPKGLISIWIKNLKEYDLGKFHIALFFTCIISYCIKQEFQWGFFSVTFWLSFIGILISFLLSYDEAADKELGDYSFAEPIGFFKIIGFSLALYIFFIGVAKFKTIKNDTMPIYAEVLCDYAKDRIKEMLQPSKPKSSGEYDDPDPYFRGHLGKE